MKYLYTNKFYGDLYNIYVKISNEKPKGLPLYNIALANVMYEYIDIYRLLPNLLTLLIQKTNKIYDQLL